jgi:sterol desaturase/sphingolipid hydroxylase (fatty acid hydroxylase superfamily)
MARGRPIRTDIVYTIINRLGLLLLVIFGVLNPAALWIDGTLRFRGYIPPTLEQLVPALAPFPLMTLFAYLLIIDFSDYWRHRLQHRVPWWWALHSLHHDQRQMTLWSDDRNHFLDDLVSSLWRGGTAVLIGVPPDQFIIIGLRLIESLSHTNVRLSLGRIVSRCVVGPQLHRIHHSIEHAAPPFERTMGCNFAIILPLWDILFGTFHRPEVFPATGIAGVEGAAARIGYFRHQFDGLRRLQNAVKASLPLRPAAQ